MFRTQLKPVFENIVSGIVIKLFFGADNSDLKIGDGTFNEEINHILGEARDQSNEWVTFLFGEKAYQWGLKGSYRDLRDRIERARGVVRTLLEKKMEYTSQSKKKNYNDLF